MFYNLIIITLGKDRPGKNGECYKTAGNTYNIHTLTLLKAYEPEEPTYIRVLFAEVDAFL